MAMNGTVCGTAVHNALVALRATLKAEALASGEAPANADERIWQQVCTTILAHIEANMVVASTGPVTGGGGGTANVTSTSVT